MFSIESFHNSYETDTVEMSVKDRSFTFLVPKSIDCFINREDVFQEFPLWSKVWEASIVLSEYLSSLPVRPEQRFLEIGCGMGVSGIVAAAFGHRVTMTEYNADALNFAHANTLLNGLSPERIQVLELDWHRPRIEGLFDVIFGSEVVYSPRDFDPLLGLFTKFLKPGGEIILAEGLRKTSMDFFSRISEIYDISARKKVLRSGTKESRVILGRMTPKHQSRSGGSGEK